MKTIHLMAAAAALLLAGACTKEMTTTTVEYQGNAPLFEGQEESPCMAYSISFEYITGGVPEAVKEKIHGFIVQRYIILDEESNSTDVPAACKAWEERTVQGYYNSLEEDKEEYEPDYYWMYNWDSELYGNFSTKCEARGWQTYVVGGTDYQGGAHPFSYASYTVFDMKTGNVVTEEDFLDTESDELWELLFSHLLTSGEDEITEEDLFEMPTFNGNFSVSDEGITWLYNPYEIAAYVYGPIEASLSWEELKPYLKK